MGKTESIDVVLLFSKEDGEEGALELARRFRVAGLHAVSFQADGDASPSALGDALRVASCCVVLATPGLARRIDPSNRPALPVPETQWREITRAYLITTDDSDLADILAGALGRSFTVLRDGGTASGVAAEIIAEFPSRNSLTVRRVQGPSDILVFGDLGIVVLASKGGAANGQVDVIEFSGQPAEGQFAALGQYPADTAVHFDEDVVFAHLNLVNTPFIDQAQVDSGTMFNFGTDAEPMVLRPFYASSGAVFGTLTQGPPPTGTEAPPGLRASEAHMGIGESTPLARAPSASPDSSSPGQVVQRPDVAFYTIGYGGREPREFLTLLSAHGVKAVADVRLRPDRASMGAYTRAKTPDKGIEKLLSECGIAYVPLVELGNIFLDLKDWQSRYRQLLRQSGELLTERLLSVPRPCCILCAEKRASDCHRLIVAEYLIDRGFTVEHIAGGS